MKYNSKKTILDGIKFDSKAESAYYLFLKDEERKGKIEILDLQPKIYMTEARILYKPDFKIEENGEIIYIDVKGFKTPVFAIKLRLWKFYGNGTLRIVKGKKVEEFNTVIKITRPF